MQCRITEPGPLLDGQGKLAETGYATRLIRQYDRKQVKAPSLRLKEWDYYYIGNDCFGLALTVADNGYMSMDSISPYEKRLQKRFSFSRQIAFFVFYGGFLQNCMI